MKYKALVALAKENGIEKAHQTKCAVLTAKLEEMGVLVNGEPATKSENRGRKVDPTSARQLRLAEQAAKAEANGGVIKLGRDINPDSERQKRLAEQAAKAEANGGVLKRGREVDPNSARQLKIAAQAEFIANGGMVKRGRPAKAKVEESK